MFLVIIAFLRVFHLFHNFWTNLESNKPLKMTDEISVLWKYNVDGQKIAKNGCKTAICQSTYFWDTF